MLFNSIDFLLFFPVVTVAYFLLPHPVRWLLLLGASCYFYAAFIPYYILILVFLILIDYAAGIFIEDSKASKRKLILVVSLIANVGVLALFKYFDFINGNLESLAHVLQVEYPIRSLNIILPIGLSFHTFQSMSYTIEVYRGNYKAERNLGIYALYVMFYPQLVAGPIERPQNLIHQFREKHQYDVARIADGLKLMLWGLFKKVVIADRVAVAVNNVYNNPMNYEGVHFLVATFLFAIQIYCDFSGYSDIAIGAARVMGFTLMRNFRTPYLAQSVSEFWKCWHISLSSWFRDYLYLSLGGNRVKIWRWQMNILITFAVSGLWHGANWTFVVWGMLNGFYLVFGLWTENIRKRLVELLELHRAPVLLHLWRIGVTFCLTCIAWVFFRADSLASASWIISQIIESIGSFTTPRSMFEVANDIGLNRKDIIVAMFSIMTAMMVEYLHDKHNLKVWLAQRPQPLRFVVYCSLIFSIILFGEAKASPFIYFQF